MATEEASIFTNAYSGLVRPTSKQVDNTGKANDMKRKAG